VLLNRLQKEVDALLGEKLAGFRAGRSCSEPILTLRNIIEQCYNWQKPLHINYIDFKSSRRHLIASIGIHCGKSWSCMAFLPSTSISSRQYTETRVAVSEQERAILRCSAY